MTTSPIRVMIVDDHPLVREGIRSIVAAEDGFEIVAEAGSGEEAVETAGRLLPDVVILDLSMPGEGGLRAVARLREVAPAARSLILSVHDHPEYVLEAVRAGAQGYIRKDTSPTELRQAIRTVHRGEAFFSSPVAHQLSAAVRQETLRGGAGRKTRAPHRPGAPGPRGNCGGINEQDHRPAARPQPQDSRGLSGKPHAQARDSNRGGAYPLRC